MNRRKPGRRRFLLLAASGFAAGGVGYAFHRGVRFPPPLLTSTGPAVGAAREGVEVTARGAISQDIERESFRFRAFVPEPEIEVSANGQPARIVVENIHPRAQLEVKPDQPGLAVDEERDELVRAVTVEPRRNATERPGFSWRFPNPERYRFVAIGDTGGGRELGWVLRRASELKADFLLHLGDFHYQAGDFGRAAYNLNTAGIPTYAAIGNHDFHDGWRIMYPEFHRLIGPNNAIFRLGGIEFVNLDTAADYLPAARGRRARILTNLAHVEHGASIRDRVAFTHMPLTDPDAERSHAVGRRGEARWIRDQLLSRGTANLLAGHIHIKAEHDDQGLKTYITGQGLAHADLIVERQYAEILVGDVEPGEPVRYRWEPLNMPFEAHCSARIKGMADILDRPGLKDRLRSQCGET